MGVLLALLAAVLAAPLGVLSAVPARAGVGPAALSFWRAALAWPLFAAHARATRSPPLDAAGFRAALALGGLCIAALYVTYQLALREAGVLLGTALAEAAPIWVVPIARLVLRERLSVKRLAGCGLTVAGLLVFFGDALQRGVGLRALLAGLLASVTYAAYYVASAAAAAGRPASRVLGVSMFAAALVLAPFARTARASPSGWACVALVAVVCTYGAYLTKTAALARIGAARVAALGTLEPVLATLLALAVLHERVTVALAAGLFVEMAGLALVAFPEHAPVREPARRRT